MNELGIIISPNGESKSFGIWREREKREISCSKDWHTDSFLEEIYPTAWFQNLQIPYQTNIEFQNQLDLFAKYGCVIIVNSKEESSKVGETRFVIVVPNTITSEQIDYFMKQKEKFIAFENGHYSFIDILDTKEEYSILENFYTIVDFYSYLDERKKENPKSI